MAEMMLSSCIYGRSHHHRWSVGSSKNSNCVRDREFAQKENVILNEENFEIPPNYLIYNSERGQRHHQIWHRTTKTKSDANRSQVSILVLFKLQSGQ